MSQDCLYCQHETMSLDTETDTERLYCNHYRDFIKFDSTDPPCRNQESCKGFEFEPIEREGEWKESQFDQDKNIETDYER